MLVLLVIVTITVCCGVALLGWMFYRDDSRLGMIALAALITATILAMVHAALDAV
jgi:hypothetical protein